METQVLGMTTLLIVMYHIHTTAAVPSISSCDPSRCDNGGTCYGSVIAFGCTCLPGFTGQYCEEVTGHKSETVCIVPSGVTSHSRIILTCTDRERIHILGSTQGATRNTTCRHHGGDQCMQEWDRHYVQIMCEGHSSCSLKINKQQSRCDSDSNYQHYIEVEYVCIPETQMIEICDDNTRQKKLRPPVYITSPDYAGPYENMTSCKCSLSVSGINSKIRSNIYDIDMSNTDTNTCTHEWLEHNTNPSTYNVGHKLCNASESLNYSVLHEKTLFISQGKSMDITFVTSVNLHHRRGFFTRMDGVDISGNGQLKITCGHIPYPQIITRPTTSTTTTPNPDTPSCPAGDLPLEGYFCGLGPSSRDCPNNYYCNVHPTDAFAVCCISKPPTSRPTSSPSTPNPDTPSCPAGDLPLEGYFCGRGPSRQDCPYNYRCNVHPTDAFAVCCIDNTMVTSISKTTKDVMGHINKQQGDNSNDLGLIIGLVASLVMVMIVLAVLGAFIYKKYNNKKPDNTVKPKAPICTIGLGLEGAENYNTQYRTLESISNASTRSGQYEVPEAVNQAVGVYEGVHLYEDIPYNRTPPVNANRPLPQAPLKDGVSNPGYATYTDQIKLNIPAQQTHYDYTQMDIGNAQTQDPVKDVVGNYADNIHPAAYESYTHLVNHNPNSEIYTHLNNNGTTNQYLELCPSNKHI